MKKYNVLKENNDFQQIITKSNFKKDRNIVLYYRKNNLDHYRFGISVGKKIGNAVTRNYYKRILRNIVDHNKKLCSNDKDYIIIIKKNCLFATYDQIEKSFQNLIINSNKGEKNEEKEL